MNPIEFAILAPCYKDKTTDNSFQIDVKQYYYNVRNSYIFRYFTTIKKQIENTIISFYHS